MASVIKWQEAEELVSNRLRAIGAALIGVALAISLAAACSDGAPTEPTSSTVVATGAVTSVGGAVSASGPGLTVADAIASTLEGPLLVNGFIFTRGDEVRLCSSLPGAPAPSCGEPSIEVAGLDPTAIAGLERLAGIGWTDEPTQVLGMMIDGVLTVSGTMLAQ